MEVSHTASTSKSDINRVGIGLLCVTCTDLAVLAGHNYPEKWSVVLISVTIELLISLLVTHTTVELL